MSLSRLYPLFLPKSQLRSISFFSRVQEPVSPEWERAKPFKQIPRIPFMELHKTMTEARKKNEVRNHILFDEYFRRFNSSIIAVGFPFIGDFVFVNSPEDAQIMLQNDGRYPIEPGFDFFVNYRHYRTDLFPDSKGLLGAHGEEWYEARSLVQQDMMRPKSALYYVDEISKVTQDFLDLVESRVDSNNEIADILPLVYRWALEAVGALFLDSRIGCLEEPPAKEAEEMVKCVDVCLGDPLVELVGQPPIWKYFKTKSYRTFNASAERMFEVTSKLIDNAVAQNKDKVYANRDEMSVLGKLTEKGGPNSTLPRVMAMDALFAGIDTTGNTSALMYYLLGSNPDKQELLYQEVAAKLPPGKPLTASILNELKYPKAVQQETMRLRPVVGGLGRLTQKDLVFSGYRVPKGTRVNMVTVMTMRSEKHFPEAHKFLPERWIRGCPMSKKTHPYVFIPFSHGPRMCIGRRFAELEMQTLAIETVRRYKLEYDGPNVDLISPFVNRPDKPIKIKFTKRN